MSISPGLAEAGPPVQGEGDLFWVAGLARLAGLSQRGTPRP